MGFSLNTSQTTHEANDHGRHASIDCERKVRIVCLFWVFHWIVQWWWQRCFWNVPFVLYFVGMHFRIFVRKFLIRLRTYASPQKLAQPLYNVISSLWTTLYVHVQSDLAILKFHGTWKKFKIAGSWNNRVRIKISNHGETKGIWLDFKIVGTSN